MARMARASLAVEPEKVPVHQERDKRQGDHGETGICRPPLEWPRSAVRDRDHENQQDGCQRSREHGYSE